VKPQKKKDAVPPDFALPHDYIQPVLDESAFLLYFERLYDENRWQFVSGKEDTAFACLPNDDGLIISKEKAISAHTDLVSIVAPTWRVVLHYDHGAHTSDLRFRSLGWESIHKGKRMLRFQNFDGDENDFRLVQMKLQLYS
jgi:hypothetical protein